MVLNETGNSVVEAVRQRERRASLAASFAIARPNVSEKFFRRIGGWRFGKGRSDKFSAVVVRAADEDFLPRLLVGGRQIVFFSQLLDFFRRKRTEEPLCEFA